MTDLELIRAHKNVVSAEETSEGVYKIVYRMPDLKVDDTLFKRKKEVLVNITISPKDLQQRLRSIVPSVRGRWSSYHKVLFHDVLFRREDLKTPMRGSWENPIHPNLQITPEGMVTSWCVHDTAFLADVQKGKGAYELLLGLDRILRESSYYPNVDSVDTKGERYFECSVFI